MPVYVECGCTFYLVGDHGLYSCDVVGLGGDGDEVEGLCCDCHVWLLFVWPCLAGGLVVVRVVWGMRAPPLMGLADGEQLVVSDWACAELCLE